jgi:hypothetical protein
MLKFRLWLIKKLIGTDLKVISNIKITSDIVQYNNGLDLGHNIRVQSVSSRQSFVLDPGIQNNVW